MGRSRATAPRPTTMSCASCDVTWRGETGDPCWSCGDPAAVVEAPPYHVKVPTESEHDRAAS